MQPNIAQLLKSGLFPAPAAAAPASSASGDDAATNAVAAAAAAAAKEPLAANIQRLASLFAAQAQQSGHNGLKMPPPNLSLPGNLSFPFSQEMLWRWQNPYAPAVPPSPLENPFRSQLPAGMCPNPKLWTREDVAAFMRHCEREYDLDKIDMDKFQMNGE